MSVLARVVARVPFSLLVLTATVFLFEVNWRTSYEFDRLLSGVTIMPAAALGAVDGLALSILVLHQQGSSSTKSSTNRPRPPVRFSAPVAVSTVACQPAGWSQALVAVKTLVAQLRAEQKCGTAPSTRGVAAAAEDYLPLPVFLVLDLLEEDGAAPSPLESETKLSRSAHQDAPTHQSTPTHVGALEHPQGQDFLRTLNRLQDTAADLIRLQLLDVGRVVERAASSRLLREETTGQHRDLSRLFTKEFKQCASVRLLLPDLLPVRVLIHLDADMVVVGPFLGELVRRALSTTSTSTSPDGGVLGEDHDHPAVDHSTAVGMIGDRPTRGEDHEQVEAPRPPALWMSEEVASNLKVGWYHEHSILRPGDLRDEVMAGRAGYNSGVLVVNVDSWRQSGIGLLTSRESFRTTPENESRRERRPALSLWDGLDAAHQASAWFFHLGDQDLLNWISRRRPGILGTLPCEFNIRSDSRCSNSTLPAGGTATGSSSGTGASSTASRRRDDEGTVEGRRREAVVRPVLVHANRGLLLEVLEQRVQHGRGSSTGDGRGNGTGVVKNALGRLDGVWPGPATQLGRRWRTALQSLVEGGPFNGGAADVGSVCSLWEQVGLEQVDLSPYRLKDIT